MKYKVLCTSKNFTHVITVKTITRARWIMNMKIWRYSKITEVHHDGTIGRCIDLRRRV